MKHVYETEANEAYEQYMYGRYGGEDVASWRLSQSSQFKELWKELPIKIESVCHSELEKTWLELLNT